MLIFAFAGCCSQDKRSSFATH